MFALANTLAAAGFVPARLEAAMLAACREAGASAWYVPDDFLTLGQELVTNGSFSSADGWTTGVGVSIGSGVITCDASIVGTVATNNSGESSVSGKAYFVSYEITAVTAAGGGVSIGVGASSSEWTTPRSTVGVYQEVVVASSTAGKVRMLKRNTTNFAGSIDNVSVKEIVSAKLYQDSAGTLPTYRGGVVGRVTDAVALNNITQSTSGNRPVLSKNVLNHYSLTFDGTNDSLAAPSSVVGSTLSQSYTLIAWGKVGAVGANRRACGDGIRRFGIDATGKLAATHSGSGTRLGNSTLSAGQQFIAEAVYVSGIAAFTLNGAADGGGALGDPAGSPVATNIGQSGSASEYWNSEISGVVVCPAVMTEAQRLAVRRFAAAQMGLTL